MISHIDLFTGIGGFTLACSWLGIKTDVMCEIDSNCQDFLKRTYPDIPLINDIRRFDGKEWKNRYLLTAGVPCQPASRAGRQRGEDDDRWLWPETIRVVAEAEPCWCLFENPTGIYDVGFDRILSELESIGYEVGTVEIPACAVNSPQVRKRVWILAFSKNERYKGYRGWGLGNGEEGWKESDRSTSSCFEGNMANSKCSRSNWKAVSVCGQESGEVSMPTGSSQSDMADTTEQRLERGEWEKLRESESSQNIKGFWDDYMWVNCADGKVRRSPYITLQLSDVISSSVPYELEKVKMKLGLHRSIIAALGNSIVPQVAYEIIRAMLITDGLIN
jgi:DNA (cytosine-5)-methyltransferase 1